MGHNLAIIKRFTVLALSLWNLVKIITSWVGYIGWISAYLHQKCRFFFINGNFLRPVTNFGYIPLLSSPCLNLHINNILVQTQCKLSDEILQPIEWINFESNNCKLLSLKLNNRHKSYVTQSLSFFTCIFESFLYENSYRFETFYSKGVLVFPSILQFTLTAI